MLDYSDFCKLASQEKESLIALIGQLVSRIDQLEAEKSVDLPELPPVGQYVIKDARGVVRMVADETKVLRDQVEGVAILLSLDDYVTVQFNLNDCSELLSEWVNGMKVERC